MNYKIEYMNKKCHYNIIIIFHFININKAFVFSNIDSDQHLEIEFKIEI